MNIISYRGPGMAGGVSPILRQVLGTEQEMHHWWFPVGPDIVCQSNGGMQTTYEDKLPKEVVEGHYRYCNEFLWPVMHDLSDYANYKPKDRVLYERFNRLLSREIKSQGTEPVYFVQDYQLALLPNNLKRIGDSVSAVFWHIPWPKYVPEAFLPAITDLASSLLAAKFLGFHTMEYARNFLDFVERHLVDAQCSFRHLMVTRGYDKAATLSFLGAYSSLSAQVPRVSDSQQTQIVVAPLGLDLNYWWSLSTRHRSAPLPGELGRTPYVLSVDRADYTKGIQNRLQAIDVFFQRAPQFKGNVTFVQVCGRSRSGIKAYDDYWTQCQKLVVQINDRYRSSNWMPILSSEGPFDASQLAVLYRNANVMLVNPLRDGLNLTAKEFVACQSADPGVLALSPFAGAWEELRPHALEVNPFDAEQMAKGIYAALTMPRCERSLRAEKMLETLERHTLKDWFDTFAHLLSPERQPAVTLRRTS